MHLCMVMVRNGHWTLALAEAPKSKVWSVSFFCVLFVFLLIGHRSHLFPRGCVDVRCIAKKWMPALNSDGPWQRSPSCRPWLSIETTVTTGDPPWIKKPLIKQMSKNDNASIISLFVQCISGGVDRSHLRNSSHQGSNGAGWSYLYNGSDSQLQSSSFATCHCHICHEEW